MIDKIGVKNIDLMAGVGNAAAHNLPDYKAPIQPPNKASSLQQMLQQLRIGRGAEGGFPVDEAVPD